MEKEPTSAPFAPIIGAVLGVGGHMATLRRTAVGPFTTDDALSLDDLSREAIQAKVIPAAQAMPWFSSSNINAFGTG